MDARSMLSKQDGTKLMNVAGFTIIELLIAMALTAIVGIAVIGNYINQQRTFNSVRQVANLQQQLRGAMFILEQEVRMAGYDPLVTGLFGVLDVQRRDLDNGVPDPNGFPSLAVSFDWSPGEPPTSGDGLLNEPAPIYRLFDENGNGLPDLARVVGGNTELVAEGIEAMAFAFAYIDGSGDLARLPGGEIIWAVDTGNDNLLDARLDGLGGTIALGENVELDRIRMVRIWLLARARDVSQGYLNSQAYVVGDQLVNVNDGFRRRMLVRTVQCRNLGL